jgi:hypothetical protein
VSDRPKILVVANPPEQAQIAQWLGELEAVEVLVGDGSDETFTDFQRERPSVVVLTVGLLGGDALGLSQAMRGEAPTSLILIGDPSGPVRNALEAMDFGCDRFLRRPLSKGTLLYATRSCLSLGHAELVGAVATIPRPSPESVSLAGLQGIGPVAPQAADTGGGVLRHALTARIDAAMSEAIDAFLHDRVEDALSSPPDLDDVEEDFDDPVLASGTATDLPFLADEDYEEMEVSAAESTPPPQAPPWREETHIISGGDPVAPGSAPPPVPPDEARTGTFVSELRRHMDAVEERLFGSSSDLEPPPSSSGEESADIDLDSIGVTVPGIGDHNMLAPPAMPTWERDPDDALRSSDEIPEAPPLRPDIGPAIRGDLRDEDVAFLIARLHREGFTGRVLLRRGEAEKSIYFEDGRLVFATSNLPQDRMGDLLFREGKITRDQHARSREIVAETGRRMGEILVEMGFLKRRELLPAVRRHVEDIVYSLFGWDAGTFVTSPGDSARDEKIRLATHPTALVLEGIRRKVSLERLRLALGGAQTVVAPLKRDEIPEVLADADLSPEERHAADLFDGRRSLGDIVGLSRLDETAVYQLAHGLVALSRARVVERTREGTDSGHRTTGVSAPVSSITGAADASIDRERVLAKHAHVREADYFTVLGVRRDSSGFEIMRAYDAARRDYAAESFSPEVQRELAGELRDIAVVLDEAFRILRADEIRADYLKHT